MRYGLLVAVALIGLCGPVLAAFADEPPVEYQLAVAQRNAYVAPDDPLVLAYAYVLDRVQPHCNESRPQLGNIAVALADKINQQSLYSATPLSLLVGLEEVATSDAYADKQTNCAEILAVVAYLASQGE